MGMVWNPFAWETRLRGSVASDITSVAARRNSTAPSLPRLACSTVVVKYSLTSRFRLPSLPSEPYGDGVFRHERASRIGYGRPSAPSIRGALPDLRLGFDGAS